MGACSASRSTHDGPNTKVQERLPGLDNGQVIRAMGSTADAYFTIWTRPAGPPAPTPPTALN